MSSLTEERKSVTKKEKEKEKVSDLRFAILADTTVDSR